MIVLFQIGKSEVVEVGMSAFEWWDMQPRLLADMKVRFRWWLFWV